MRQRDSGRLSPGRYAGILQAFSSPAASAACCPQAWLTEPLPAESSGAKPRTEEPMRRRHAQRSQVQYECALSCVPLLGCSQTALVQRSSLAPAWCTEQHGRDGVAFLLANRWDCFATKSALNAASTLRGRSIQHAANDEGVNVGRPQGGNGSRVPMRFRAQGCATEPLWEPPHSSVVLKLFEALDACCAVRCMSSTARPRTAAKLHAARRAVNVACYILHAVRCTVRVAMLHVARCALHCEGLRSASRRCSSRSMSAHDLPRTCELTVHVGRNGYALCPSSPRPAPAAKRPQQPGAAAWGPLVGKVRHGAAARRQTGSHR